MLLLTVFIVVVSHSEVIQYIVDVGNQFGLTSSHGCYLASSGIIALVVYCVILVSSRFAETRFAEIRVRV